MQQVLVTGANGFIGSHLVEALLKQDIKVRCLVRKSSNLRWIEDLPVELVTGDLLHPETLTSAVTHVDTVFHLGGRVKSSNEEGFYKANVLGTVNLLKAVTQHAPALKRFVLVSSQAAVGPNRHSRPSTEQDACFPLTPYGASKLAAEEAAEAFRAQIPLTIVRPAVVGGPRDVDLFESFKMVRRGFKVLFGWRPHYGSYIDVSDLVCGLLLAAEHPEAINETFFLSGDDEVRLGRFQEAIAKALDVRAISLRLPFGLLYLVGLGNDMRHRLTGRESLVSVNKVREFQQTHWTCNGSKARQLLGFKAEIELEEAMIRAAAWYREAGWLD